VSDVLSERDRAAIRALGPAHERALLLRRVRHTPGGHPHNQQDHAGGGAVGLAKKAAKTAAKMGQAALDATPARLVDDGLGPRHPEHKRGTIAWSNGDPGWSAEETDRHLTAMENYRAADFSPINKRLRGLPYQLSSIDDEALGEEGFRRRIGEHIELLDEVMEHSRLTDDITVIRGTSTGRGVFGDALDGDLTGFEWTEGAYVSTTANPAIAEYFTITGLTMNIHAPKGTGAMALSGMTGERYGKPVEEEAEVLLERGLRMRVVKDSGPGIPRQLEVEVVPGGAEAPRSEQRDAGRSAGKPKATKPSANLLARMSMEPDDYPTPSGAKKVPRAQLRELVAREVQALLRGDDVDDDPIGELDDDTLILLQAMHELDEESGVEGRAWNPALHKRYPKGHPLGGKFRPMVDLLKLAIQKHDGNGHPFDNFSREQLRKAAKARGITLKRGEDKDSIAAKLLADLGGAPAKPSAAVKANPAKTPKSTKKPSGDALAPMPGAKVAAGDFSGLKRVGPSEGTTPGGVFQAADGSRWYVKAQQSPKHAANEALASALYRAAGIDVPTVVRGKGTPGLPGDSHTATQMVDGAVPNLGLQVANGNDGYLNEVRKGFALDAWLANWDVVGEGGEHPWANIVQGADGKPHRIDVGGALLFRGLGKEKGDRFGPQVVEFDTMRDVNKGRRHSQVFSDMTDQQVKESVDRVKAITPAKIRKLVADHGMDQVLADLLIERRKDLISRIGASKPAKGWKGAATGEQGLSAAPVKITGSISETRGLLEKFGLDPDTAQWATNGFHDYQDGLYGPMNRALLDAAGGDLRAGSYYGLDDDGISMVEAMDKTIRASKLTKDVIVFRGERAPARNFEPGAWSLTGGMEGMEWTFHPFGSSSADSDVAQRFAVGPTTAPKDQAQPTVFRILARKGTPAVHLEGNLETEQELLLGRSLKYRVVKDYGVEDGLVRRIDVEVVPA